MINGESEKAREKREGWRKRRRRGMRTGVNELVMQNGVNDRK